MNVPQVVSPAEWEAAHERLLAKEKQAARARDALAAERRRLPMVGIEKDYVFDGPESEASLHDLFDGRRQLIVYHFMFAPGVHGWPSAGCPGCSMVVDNMGPPGPSARSRHILGPCVPRATGADRAVQGADGLDGAMVLVARQRLQRRLRCHD
jgi:predicted dithiol-disulfide oxidoreductase (DUF899 family)